MEPWDRNFLHQLHGKFFAERPVLVLRPRIRHFHLAQVAGQLLQKWLLKP
jgi:hypothetical protein